MSTHSTTTSPVVLDINNERECQEVADTVFGEPSHPDLLHMPAKQVFQAILIALHREGETNQVTREAVVEFLRLDREAMRARLGEHPDLQRYAQHLESESKAGLKVYQTLRAETDEAFDEALRTDS